MTSRRYRADVWNKISAKLKLKKLCMIDKTIISATMNGVTQKQPR